MPRYVLESSDIGRAVRSRAAQQPVLRFPELDVEHGFVVRDPRGIRHVWVLRAPSEAHVRRWAETVGLVPSTVGRVELDAVLDLQRTDPVPGDTPIHDQGADR